MAPEWHHGEYAISPDDHSELVQPDCWMERHDSDAQMETL